MTPERWKTIKAILNDALDVPAAERAGVVRERCGGDAELEREVEAYLAAGPDSLGTLDSPAFSAFFQEAVAASPAVPGELIGPYRVHELIGRGGMGEVYRATDTRLGRRVALKSLSADLAASSRRFERQILHEAQAAAHLSHPNIVAVFDVLDDDGRTHVVMEYLDGEPLSARLERGPLSESELYDVALPVAAALTHAHERGILHCDIKPANIFLTRDGGVKVLDFGLARPMASSLAVDPVRGHDTDAPAIPPRLQGVTAALLRHAGTPRYMAPEQLEGVPIDERSDLYSFGLVLLEAVVGRGDVATDDEPVARLETVPYKWLRPVLRRALATSRDDRFESVGAMRTALVAAAHAAGVGTAPKSTWRRIGFAAGLVALLVSTFAVSSWLRGPPAAAPSTPILAPRAVTANSSSVPVIGAALSRDGRRMAYSDKRGIWVGEIGSRAPAILLPDSVGRRVTAWIDDTPHVLAAGTTDAGAIFGPTGQVRVLGTDEVRRYPSSNPRIYVQAEASSVLDLHDGPSVRRLDGAALWIPPTWNPEATFVVAVAGDAGPEYGSGRFQLRAYPVADGRPAVVLDIPKGNTRVPVTILPGGVVWYCLTEGDGSALWERRVDLRTGLPLGDARRLARWPGFTVVQLVASHDGTRVGLVAGRRFAHVVVADWDGRHASTFRRLTTQDSLEMLRFWSADSRAIYFDDGEPTDTVLRRQGLLDDTPTLVQPTPADHRTAGLVGRTVALVRQFRGSGMEEIRAADLRDAVEPRATESWEPVRGQRWQCVVNGRCYGLVVSPQTGQLLLMELDPRTGERHTDWQLPQSTTRFAVAPRGRTVAALDSGGAVWFQRDRTATKPAFQFRDIKTMVNTGNLQMAMWQIGSLAWSADEQGLFVGRMDYSRLLGYPPCTLVFVDLTGSERVIAKDVCNALPSPDGRHLAGEAYEVSANLWVVDANLR